MSELVASETGTCNMCGADTFLDKGGRVRVRCDDHRFVPHNVNRPSRPERYVDKDGYVMIWINGTGRVAEHRLVMEKVLGRPLARGEAVHHINGDRADNRPKNLELWWHPQSYGSRVKELLQYVQDVHGFMPPSDTTRERQ